MEKSFGVLLEQPGEAVFLENIWEPIDGKSEKHQSWIVEIIPGSVSPHVGIPPFWTYYKVLQILGYMNHGCLVKCFSRLEWGIIPLNSVAAHMIL